MSNESAERRAILELGQALQDAWNRGDAAGYASLFTDDAVRHEALSDRAEVEGLRRLAVAAAG